MIDSELKSELFESYVVNRKWLVIVLKGILKRTIVYNMPYNGPDGNIKNGFVLKLDEIRTDLTEEEILLLLTFS